MSLLDNLAAELLDHGVIKLTERVEVGNLLVFVESDRGTLLESENAYVHCDHVLADKHINVVKGASLVFLLSMGRLEMSSLSSPAAGDASGASAALASASRGRVWRVLAIVDGVWSVG